MVTHITDFDGAVVEYRYNPMGQVEEIIDPTGVGTHVRTINNQTP